MSDLTLSDLETFLVDSLNKCDLESSIKCGILMCVDHRESLWNTLSRVSVFQRGLANASLLPQIIDLKIQDDNDRDFRFVEMAITLVATSPSSQIIDIACHIFSESPEESILQEIDPIVLGGLEAETLYRDLVIQLDEHNLANSLYLIVSMCRSQLRFRKSLPGFRDRKISTGVIYALATVSKRAPVHISRYFDILIGHIQDDTLVSICVFLLHLWCLDPLAAAIAKRGSKMRARTDQGVFEGVFDKKWIADINKKRLSREVDVGRLLIQKDILLFDLDTTMYLDPTDNEWYSFSIDIREEVPLELSSHLRESGVFSDITLENEDTDWTFLCLLYLYMIDPKGTTERFGPEDIRELNTLLEGVRMSFVPWITKRPLVINETRIMNYRQILKNRGSI